MKKTICTFMCAVIAITFMPFMSLAEESEQTEYPSPVIAKDTQTEDVQTPAEEKTEEELQKELIEKEKLQCKKLAPHIARIKVRKSGTIEIGVNPVKKKTVVQYEMQRSTSKKFKSNIRKYKKKKYQTIVWFYNNKHLKKGKKYYYRVRAVFKLSDGTTYTCPWSKYKCAKSIITN